MNNRKYLVVFTVILLLLSIAGCGASTAQSPPKGDQNSNNQQPIVLKLSHPVPATSFHGQIYDYFAKTVEEETKGQVKIQAFPSGTLATDMQILDSVKKGTIDIGHFTIPYIDPTIKELTPLEVPGAFPGDKYSDVVKSTEAIVDKIFAKYGIHYLGTDDQSKVTFVASKKVGKPILSPADLKGYSVRTPGKWGGEAIKLWGGTPVTIPLPDLTNALQLGTVDVGYTGWIITGPFKLYEVAPYITITSLQEQFAGLMMSDKAWKMLNTDQQQGIKRAVVKWQDYSHELSGKLEKEFMDQVKKSGATIVTLTPEQNAAFKTVTDPLWEQIKNDVGPEGQELINSLKGLR